MKDYEVLELPNKSILKKIGKGQGVNWVFIPGGPGLGHEYLIGPVEQFKLSGSKYIYEFPTIDPTISDLEIFNHIKDDFKSICSLLDQVIFVGHSFGGMLLQTLDLERASYKKQVLLCSMPRSAGLNFAANAFKNFSKGDQDLIKSSEAVYENLKNTLNFKNLFLSWTPYYVEAELRSKCTEMLNDCSYDHDFYEWGNRFFFEHHNKIGKIADETVIINVQNDKLCPSGIFGVEEIVLSGSAHFPWMDNVMALEKILIKLEQE